MTDPLDTVTIRDLTTLEEYSECVELQEETWGRGFSERVPGAILRVSQKIGGVTAGAFDGNGRMIGFVFGMTGLREGQPAHWSDMLAVREEARGRHIGDQLKHYQRERCISLGVQTMLWTADPLVARNAHFNINRLGARPVEYVENTVSPRFHLFDTVEGFEESVGDFKPVDHVRVTVPVPSDLFARVRNKVATLECPPSAKDDYRSRSGIRADMPDQKLLKRYLRSVEKYTPSRMKRGLRILNTVT